MIIANIVSIPIYLQFISISEYGLWLVVSSLIALVTIFDFGGDTLLIKQLSNAKIFNTLTSITYIYISLSFKLLLACIFIIYALLIVFFFNQQLVSNQEANGIGLYAFIVGMIYLVFIQFLSSLASVLISQNMLFKVNLMNFLVGIFNILITLIFLSHGFNIISFAIAQLITCLIAIVWLCKQVSNIHINLSLNKKVFGEMKKIMPNLLMESFIYLKSFYFIRLLHLFRNNFMNIFLSGAISTSLVGIFNITNKIPSLIPGYIAKVANALFPSLSADYASNKIENLKKTYSNLIFFITRITLFIMINLLFINEAFIALWVGSDNFAGKLISSLVIIYLFPSCLSAIIGSMIYASGNFEKYSLFAIFEIISTSLFVYLGFIYFGLVGAVIGFIIPINFTVIFLLKHAANILTLDLKNLLLNNFKKNIIPFSASFIGAYFLSIFNFDAHSWINLFAFVIVVALINILSVEGLRLYRSENYSMRNVKLIFMKNFIE